MRRTRFNCGCAIIVKTKLRTEADLHWNCGSHSLSYKQIGSKSQDAKNMVEEKAEVREQRNLQSLAIPFPRAKALATSYEQPIKSNVLVDKQRHR